jgi:1,2-diacylglycerol 3-beta-glucosyltransferase
VGWIDALLCLLALIPASAGLYVAGLALVALFAGTPRQPRRSAPLRIAVLIPAHNESLSIASTVVSLLAVDYPPDHRRLVVLADNCSDDTAARAVDAGAGVIERHQPERRGKGHALSDTFPGLLADPTLDAIVVVDADTTVSTNLLWQVSDHLRDGAKVVQARYGVAERDRSWRTRLLHIALTAFHDVRSLGRERLGLSCGLRGNGMGFSRAALEAVPHRSVAIVEDAEYGIRLGMAGVRVTYLHDAVVLGDMPSDARSSGIQRQRWEGGRIALRRLYAPELLRHTLKTRSRVSADLLADLLVPPLGQLVVRLVMVFAALVGLGFITGHRFLAVRVAGAGLVGAGLYVFEGWRRSGTGLRGLRDLACGPFYVVWKLFGNRGGSRPPNEWVRTPRGGEEGRMAEPVTGEATDAAGTGHAFELRR